MKLDCVYFIVKNMQKSIAFYEALLEQKISSENINRWGQFNLKIGTTIALYNPEFDFNALEEKEKLNEHYNQEYIEFIKNNKTKYGSNSVLNFSTDNLKSEYERIKKLDIGKVTEIMYVNIVVPYYFFMVEDPDGNLIEITGELY